MMSARVRILCSYLLGLLDAPIGRSAVNTLALMDRVAKITSGYNRPSSFTSLDGEREVGFVAPTLFEILPPTDDRKKHNAESVESDSAPPRQPHVEVRAFLSEFVVRPDEVLFDRQQHNLKFAVSQFSLDDIEQAILLLGSRNSEMPDAFGTEDWEGDDLIGVFKQICSLQGDDDFDAIAGCLGISAHEVARRLAPSARLVSSGLLVPGTGDPLFGLGGRWRIPKNVVLAMGTPNDNQAAWTQRLMGRKVEPDLEWGDYDHIEALRDISLKALNGLRDHHHDGIGILLVGPVGTGKSAFAATLAAKAGRVLWSVGEIANDSDGSEQPSRMERLACMRLASKILEHSTADSLILFDEAEDLLTAPPRNADKRSEFSKAFLNRQIETCKVPVVWTTNTLDGIDDATLRRMSVIIQMDTPKAAVRARIWKRVAERRGLEISAEEIASISQDWASPPAIADRAALITVLTGGGRATLDHVLEGFHDALGIDAPMPPRTGKGFDLELANPDVDLAWLKQKLTVPGKSRGWGMCLHGPSGTGKSMFARHLAEHMGIDVIFRHASDLLSKWNGQTEKNIAAAFAEARRKRYMLIIDEVDSLLASRENDSSTQDVSRVNEMLAWMDCLTTPFVCTTNRLKSIDSATHRRFVFTIEMRCLSKQQANLAFRRILGAEAPGQLPNGLSPGDFASVALKADLLDETDPKVLLEWMADRARLKTGGSGQSMGFLSNVNREAGEKKHGVQEPKNPPMHHPDPDNEDQVPI